MGLADCSRPADSHRRSVRPPPPEIALAQPRLLGQRAVRPGRRLSPQLQLDPAEAGAARLRRRAGAPARRCRPRAGVSVTARRPCAGCNRPAGAADPDRQAAPVRVSTDSVSGMAAKDGRPHKRRLDDLDDRAGRQRQIKAAARERRARGLGLPAVEAIGAARQAPPAKARWLTCMSPLTSRFCSAARGAQGEAGSATRPVARSIISACVQSRCRRR